MSRFLETAYPGSQPSIAILRPFLQLTLSATIMAVLPLKSAIPICDRRETEGGILEKRMAEKKPLWVRWTTKVRKAHVHVPAETLLICRITSSCPWAARINSSPKSVSAQEDIACYRFDPNSRTFRCYLPATALPIPCFLQ